MTLPKTRTFIARLDAKRLVALTALPLILLAGCGKEETIPPAATTAAPATTQASAPATSTSPVAAETTTASETPQATDSNAPTSAPATGSGSTKDGTVTADIAGKKIGPFTKVKCAGNAETMALSAENSGDLKLFGAVLEVKKKTAQGVSFMLNDGYTFASTTATVEINGNVYTITGTGDGIDGSKVLQGAKFTATVTCK